MQILPGSIRVAGNKHPGGAIFAADLKFVAFNNPKDSKQVVILVPTTILAEQHFNTFSNRLSAFPTNIAFLSRFQTKNEQKKIIEDLKKGLIDIIIGTHRLLQKDKNR